MAIVGLAGANLAGVELGVAGLGGVAVAQRDDGCREPSPRGPVEISPAFGSRAVAQNALIRVRYSESFFSLPESLPPQDSFTLFRCDAEPCTPAGAPVEGTISLSDDTLLFVPRDLLVAGGSYLAVAVGLDQTFEAEFSVIAGAGGAAIDMEAPEFGPVTGFSTTSLAPSCEVPDGGFRVDVSLRPAVNELAGADVEYLLFLTRGNGIDGPELRARARGVPSEVVMAFVLTPEEASSTICFTVQAVDGAGNVGELADTVCEDPIQGNFFEPLCASSGRSFDTAGRRREGRARERTRRMIATLCGVLFAILLVLRRRSVVLNRLAADDHG